MASGLGSLKSAIFDRQARKQCVTVSSLILHSCILYLIFIFIHVFLFSNWLSVFLSRQYQSYILGLNAYDRHKKFINDYGLSPLFLFISLPILLFVLFPVNKCNPNLLLGLGIPYYYAEKCVYNFINKLNFLGLQRPQNTDNEMFICWILNLVKNEPSPPSRKEGGYNHSYISFVI